MILDCHCSEIVSEVQLKKGGSPPFSPINNLAASREVLIDKMIILWVGRLYLPTHE